MAKLYSLTLMLISVLAAGCVTSGAGSETSVVAGVVVVFSHLATSAQAGDATAKQSWCSVFNLVHAATQVKDESGQPPVDKDLIEKLTPDVHLIMRESGYQMHRQQIAIVIKDALQVSRNQDALVATTNACNLERK